LAAIQVQIQTLLATIGEGEGEMVEGSNTRSNTEIAKLTKFNKKAEKVKKFIIVCKLYLRMKIKKIPVEEQIQ